MVVIILPFRFCISCIVWFFGIDSLQVAYLPFIVKKIKFVLAGLSSSNNSTHACQHIISTCSWSCWYCKRIQNKADTICTKSNYWVHTGSSLWSRLKKSHQYGKVILMQRDGSLSNKPTSVYLPDGVHLPRFSCIIQFLLMSEILPVFLYYIGRWTSYCNGVIRTVLRSVISMAVGQCALFLSYNKNSEVTFFLPILVLSWWDFSTMSLRLLVVIEFFTNCSKNE